MSKHKEFYPEITKRIKKIQEWVKDTDEHIEKGNKLIEKYEAQRRQKNDEANNK